MQDEFNWARGKADTDDFMTAIRRDLGEVLLTEGTMHEDVREATDLRVLALNDLRIAVRMRRDHWAEKFPREVTITTRGGRGGRSEWDKIFDDGFGDYMYYGFGDFGTFEISRSIVLRLEGLRECRRAGHLDAFGGRHVINSNGCRFRSIATDLLPPRYACITASTNWWQPDVRPIWLRPSMAVGE